MRYGRSTWEYGHTPREQAMIDNAVATARRTKDGKGKSLVVELTVSVSSGGLVQLTANGNSQFCENYTITNNGDFAGTLNSIVEALWAAAKAMPVYERDARDPD